MPHKHTRKDGDIANFNLPPTTLAKPLPVRKVKSTTSGASNKRREKHEGYGSDDTPKAFMRLLQIQTGGKRPKGLDNGEPRKSKKRKIDHEDARPAKPTRPPQNQSQELEIPRILPGERLGDFAARVDAALPVAGLARKTKRGNTLGPQERQTRMEKRMKKMQDEWRKEDVRLKEREEEERERLEEAEDEWRDLFDDRMTDAVEAGKGRKRKKKGAVATSVGVGVSKNDDDPWAKLKEKDAPKRLWDVVQAPPNLKVVPKEKFKVKNRAKINVGDVPQAAGSLKRREELGQARKAVIDGYRRMMEERRVQL